MLHQHVASDSLKIPIFEQYFSYFIQCYQKAKQLKQKKEEGNVAFKSGQLEDAYTLYSEALQIDPLNKYTNAKLFFNRATVAAKVNYIMAMGVIMLRMLCLY